MREILVAVFDTVANADRAVQTLENANIPSTSIRRYHRDDPAVPHISAGTTTHIGASSTVAAGDTNVRPHQSSGGFWSWLMGEEGGTADPTYESDHAYYGRHIEAGDTVIAVTVEQAEAQRVMDLLANHLPVKLEDAGSESVASRATTEQSRVGGTTEQEEVIPLSEEQLEIDKRRVDQNTRIRRYVVETPVERQVNLRDETVEIERRRPVEGRTPGAGAFEEREVEVRTSSERPVVTKTAQVAEEVAVRRQVTEHPETIRETVRKEQVEVDNKSKS